MPEARLVGAAPWLPWPLAPLRWWTDPVAAERLAALRIGVGLVLLFDVAACYFTLGPGFFAAGAPGGPETFAAHRAGSPGAWTLLGWGDGGAARAALWVWGAAALGLALGVGSRGCAAACWALSISFVRLCPYAHSAGDTVRTVLMFYLMLSPCGAAASVDARLAGRTGRTLVHPWPLRLLFVQLALLYFYNGLYKCLGPDWRSGDLMHWVLADLAASRWSRDAFPIPGWATCAATWIVLAWETAFPFLVLSSRTRTGALAVGIALHLGLFACLELGPFPAYMLCFYLPLAPWERLRGPEAQAPDGTEEK